MTFRHYNHDQDADAVYRIFREVGWLRSEDEQARERLGMINTIGPAYVVDHNGEPECFVRTSRGDMLYQREKLPFVAITGVVTSRVARKKGYASRTTTMALAEAANEGFHVAGLRAFDQGFYDKLGFGTTSPTLSFKFDPALLVVDKPYRNPIRFGMERSEDLHSARMHRRRVHGSVSLHNPNESRTFMVGNPKDFGLGFCDGPNGELTHGFWARPGSPHDSPLRLYPFVWQTRDQLLDLFNVLLSLSDQVKLIDLLQPADLSMYDFLRTPVRANQISRGGPLESGLRPHFHWQHRILNIEECLKQTRLRGADIRFQLNLSDPIEKYLPPEAPWRGCGGSYIIRLGCESSAERGVDGQAPVLTCDVSAFTRMWMGSSTAGSLALAGKLEAPDELICDLENAFGLPPSNPDWNY